MLNTCKQAKNTYENKDRLNIDNSTFFSLCSLLESTTPLRPWLSSFLLVLFSLDSTSVWHLLGATLQEGSRRTNLILAKDPSRSRFISSPTIAFKFDLYHFQLHCFEGWQRRKWTANRKSSLPFIFAHFINFKCFHFQLLKAMRHLVSMAQR